MGKYQPVGTRKKMELPFKLEPGNKAGVPVSW